MRWKDAREDEGQPVYWSIRLLPVLIVQFLKVGKVTNSLQMVRITHFMQENENGTNCLMCCDSGPDDNFMKTKYDKLITNAEYSSQYPSSSWTIIIISTDMIIMTHLKLRERPMQVPGSIRLPLASRKQGHRLDAPALRFREDALKRSNEGWEGHSTTLIMLCFSITTSNCYYIN